jgi:CheY-like chemotaxis protein
VAEEVGTTRDGSATAMTTSALAVDDDSTILKLSAALLRRAGFDPVHTACDGREALDLMAVHEYCVVVLDLRMPRLSGYDVLAHLATHPLPNMPKIVVATADRNAANAGFHATVVTALLTKPYDAETFLSTVRSCLETAQPPEPGA